MTMDDLSAALTEYGVNVNKPPYFAGGAAEGSSKKPRTQWDPQNQACVDVCVDTGRDEYYKSLCR